MPKIIERSADESTSSAATYDPPDHLKAYRQHGMLLRMVGGKQAIADCPLCRAGGKFAVAVESGLWRCFVCGQSGNTLAFIRRLYEVSSTSTEDLLPLAKERKLLSVSTLAAWGVRLSAIDGATLLAGWSPDGKLTQLYRRTRMRNSKGEWTWKLLPTPGIWPEGKVHALHGAFVERDAPPENIWVCEGPWDGMALWELLQRLKTDSEGRFELTGNPATSLLANSEVWAVPGQSTWRPDWTAALARSTATLLYDNDHPKEVPGGKFIKPGYDGMERVGGLLLSAKAGPNKVRWLKWGKDGYDPSLPSGHDVRDHLAQGGIDIRGRADRLADLVTRLADAPEEWKERHYGGAKAEIESLPCQQWEVLEGAWMKALRWRTALSDTLSVMLAVCASTSQTGNQLFLQVIGDPGSAKSTLCKGLLVSKTTMALRNLTGFYSGWKKPGSEDTDCSLAARMNHHTLITPEGDVIMSNPNVSELMSQQRELYDGEGGMTYKNSDKNLEYGGLRAPWIMAGTPALLDRDQSRVGDRFLKIWIEHPGDGETRAITSEAFDAEIAAVAETAGGAGAASVEPRMRKALALTGGYVDWLRANIADKLSEISVGESEKHAIMTMAELVADMRARPNSDPKKLETVDNKELPTRLTRQLARLSVCLAVVLGRRGLDDEVMRRVRKVALDTAKGRTMDIARWLLATDRSTGRSFQESGGLMASTLSVFMAVPEERLAMYLAFLRKIAVVDLVRSPQSHGRWKLTARFMRLYHTVVGG